MTVAFGLDLAAYGRGNATVLTAIERTGDEAKATLLEGSTFSNVLKGSCTVSNQIKSESDELLLLLKHGPIAIDVPIHLQGLPLPEGAIQTWELTKRPIDYAFGALAPLADKLGHCVARILAVLKGHEGFTLGRNVFQTYPAASLQLCGLPNKKYKKGEEGEKLRSKISDNLKLSGPSLSHDQLDSVICALVAVAEGDELLEANDLRAEMRQILKSKQVTRGERHDVPNGYRLLRRVPLRKVHVGRSSLSEWLQGQQK